MRLYAMDQTYLRPLLSHPGLAHEVSVDGGVTWWPHDVIEPAGTTGPDDPGGPAWLIRGPAFVAPAGWPLASLVVARSCTYLVRLRDLPQQITESPETIHLQG